ncbi:MAG TPA: electron transfer flavoprotein-ubiquinone oxidoreductase, partial [Desulfatiglandales bacterium]|nr:electron transfer flavoprotein-ubiquinone oxidoreductase [Desulfatiglandales bacterium]
LTEKNLIKSPFTPPPLDNHGNYIVSLSKLTNWLGALVEKNGVDVFTGFTATEILYKGNRVIGVRTGDKGIDPYGNKKGNFEPGIDLHAKVTILGEGARGSLTKSLIKKLNLDEGKNPQIYAIGVKEVWEVPEGNFAEGHVIHTIGYPLKNNPYGGGFIYGMKNNLVSIGLLIGLDFEDPFMDPHLEFQKFKLHPYISKILKDGKLVQYGAKTAPLGGYFSIPKIAFDGGIIVGDSAGLFVSQNLKGIHTAIKSGILAAETILDALLKDDFSCARLENYQTTLLKSYAGKELYMSRNFHQAFQRGLWIGLLKAGLQYIFGGRIIKGRLSTEPDFTHKKSVIDLYGTHAPMDEKKGTIKFDGKRTFDKESDIYYSGTTHEEQQPAHLKISDLGICYSKCMEEYLNPCTRFCPANVYEMEIDENTGKPGLKINFSNCVHCKTCDIKDPYENITWVPPEGGGGPKYTIM